MRLIGGLSTPTGISPLQGVASRLSRVVKPGIECLLAFLWMGSLSLANQQQAQKMTIERIEIRGNRRIPEDTIRFYVQSREGDIYDEGRLELDLRSLYKANFFENVEIVERNGDTGKIVTFVLKEKPAHPLHRVRRQQVLHRVEHSRTFQEPQGRHHGR